MAESYLARFDEKKHNPWMYEMVTGGNKHVPKGAPLQEALFKLQGDVIRHISKRTDAVIIGRCADYILRERTDAKVLSVLSPHPWMPVSVVRWSRRALRKKRPKP